MRMCLTNSKHAEYRAGLCCALAASLSPLTASRECRIDRSIAADRRTGVPTSVSNFTQLPMDASDRLFALQLAARAATTRGASGRCER